MDKILVVSNHAKSTYERTHVTLKDGTNYRLQTPIEVVHENTVLADEVEEIPGFNPRHDTNFLVVSQMGPRKNFAQTIKWFVEHFYEKEVGLILKTHNKGSSVIDLQHTEGVLKGILSDYPNRKCSVSLLHGDLTEGQMRALYEHDKVNCLINIAHGEGFGLPLFEAARVALPIIAMPWSGQLDFLRHNGEDLFNKVAFSMRPVQDFAVWDGVIQREAMWAYPDEQSFKDALQFVVDNYDDVKEGATELQGLVNESFSDEVLFEGFCNAILAADPVEQMVDPESLL
jgi:glycosyltransferase involved in cell wall biosynthesis